MRPKDRLAVMSGSFDPISLEEIKLLKYCKSKHDWVIVGLHSDEYMTLCEGHFMQNFETRLEIIKSLKNVDEIFKFNDSDGTVCDLLNRIKVCYPNAIITYITNMSMNNMPEKKITGIKFETVIK